MKAVITRYVIPLVIALAVTGTVIVLHARAHVPGVAAFSYGAELGIVYASANNKPLTLNAFLPTDQARPAPVVIYIHGGWWYGGEAIQTLNELAKADVYRSKHIAVFSINYRLAEGGGFPECINDCRNAIRFIRKNAARFHIDPERILVTGASTGGHLSLMAAVVPEDFADGGPAPGLEGISAHVSGAFSFCAPVDLVRFWEQGPTDVTTTADGRVTLREADGKIPADARPRLRVLFHGVIPDTGEHQALYTAMSPIGHIRKDAAPVMVCDGGMDPVVPGQEGRDFCEKLKAAGADVTYWVTPAGAHAFPSGPGFDEKFDAFVCRVLKISPAK